ncbi:MAG: Clp protease N-terminal domain-containing protein [Oryzihumus sp.]
MFERFTKRARQVVVQSLEEARAERQGEVHPEHLLLALLHDPDCLAVRVMTELGAGPEAVRLAIEAQHQAPASGLGESDAEALRAIGIDLDEVLRSVEANLGGGLGDPIAEEDLGRRGRRGRKPFAPESRKVLELALREAISLKHGWIGTEHLLLGLLRLDRGAAHEALAGLGLRYRDVRAAVVAALRATG